MAEKAFSIFRSSAGSGKTRTLAREYIRLALQYRLGYFRHILAVTFTNKATQEMKDRILAYLDKFARGENDELANELMNRLKLDAQSFRDRCRELQIEILHNYSQFSISTIDAFFQRVIRSFTHEAGLIGDYRLEVEQDDVLDEVINNLIDELGSNTQLTSWVVDFARESLENEKAWDVRQSLKEFSKEIFKEDFKQIEDDLAKTTGKPEFFVKLRKELQGRKYQFINAVKKRAGEALEIIHESGLTIDDFKYGRSGSAYRWFRRVAVINKVKDFEPGKRVLNEFNYAKNWPGKNLAKQAMILKLAEEKLIPLMREIVGLWQRDYARGLSAEVVLSNFYAFGLIADITRKLKEYKDQNNVMLLVDAPKFLNKVINDSDTPFIYEKVGSYYRNYLIDEFQDTSELQWKNFYPLIANSLDQGYRSMVVGDVKQAIYRWRGGSLKLLQQQIEKQVGKDQTHVETLKSNFRSSPALVDFFNSFFDTASQLASVESDAHISSEAYQDVKQKPSKDEEGFIYIQFLSDEPDKTWKDASLDKLCTDLEFLQQHGVRMKDIAILVRRNDEGQQIVSHLLQYKNSGAAKPGLNYNLISNESLRIDSAASVNLVLAALHYLQNPADAIARAQLAFEFGRISKSERTLTETLEVSNQAVFESYLPNDFTREKTAFRKLPLFELTETLIRVFNLHQLAGELVFLQAFQDIVLNFSARERNDIQEFLTWWEENRHTDKASLKSSGDVDAAQIFTIHKSKGLQFKHVLVPFCSWDLDPQYKSPTLWVKSEEDVYKEAGYVPVRYSGTLKDTYFSTYYKEELASSYLDNLNLLYVAFTRAENGLLITAPAPDVRNSKKTVGGLLHRSIQANAELIKNWDEHGQVWKNGELQPSDYTNVTETSEVISLRTYPVSHWRDKLVVRHAGTFFFQKEGNETLQKIEFGIYLHAILSGIRYRDEMETGLTNLVDSGLIVHNQVDQVKEELNKLFENSLVASWFDRGWTVQTEVSILVPEEGESRVDRLMMKGDKAVVVDFKTGVTTKTDQRQVLNYMDILRQMNFTDVEGYLFYTSSGEVMEVKSGKAKSKKRKDDNQLDLGLS
ncbi:UvrD-helicase domain-containing protein [Oscillatoria amoena NRMC-F 0135]|nr:UvrD-helicase domain-containing protein [Oscillatoria amoena NRMC-F 0135]